MDGWYVHVFQLVFKKGVIWGNLEGLAFLFIPFLFFKV